MLPTGQSVSVAQKQKQLRAGRGPTGGAEGPVPWRSPCPTRPDLAGPFSAHRWKDVLGVLAPQGDRDQ